MGTGTTLTTVCVILSCVVLSNVAEQNTVNMLNPCNKDQSYTLSKGDVLYIDGQQGWFDDHCDAMVQAGEGCRGICIKMASQEFKSCRVSLTMYDTDAWDLNSENEIMTRGKCVTNSGEDEVCSRSSNAIVISMQTTYWHNNMGREYEVHMVARPKCSSTSPSLSNANTKVEDTIVLTKGTFIGILAGSILGTLILTVTFFVLLYILVIRRRVLHQQSATGQSESHQPLQNLNNPHYQTPSQ